MKAASDVKINAIIQRILALIGNHKHRANDVSCFNVDANTVAEAEAKLDEILALMDNDSLAHIVYHCEEFTYSKYGGFLFKQDANNARLFVISHTGTNVIFSKPKVGGAWGSHIPDSDRFLERKNTYITLKAQDYGDTLPAAGNVGRLFFKKVSE
jgi:hypothetical protein